MKNFTRTLALVLFLACGVVAQNVAVGSGSGSFGGTAALSSQGSQSTPVTVTGPTCPLSGTETSPFSATFTAANGTAPYSFAVVSGSLTGSGLSLAATGVLSGTPPVGASSTSPYVIGVVATDAIGKTSATYSCTINIAAVPAGPVSITNSDPLPAGQLTVAYSVTLTGTGGTPPYTYSNCSGTLPNGISLTSGVLTGTPTVQSTFTFGLQATDSASTSGSCQTFHITVNAAPSCSTSPGPPTYPCSRTDLANSAPFVPVPNVGNLTGVNTIVMPTGFNGNRIVRVTDTAFPKTSGYAKSYWNDCGGSSVDNLWSAPNGTKYLFVVQNEGCGTYVLQFDSSTFQVSKTYATQFPTTGFTFNSSALGWKRGSQTILHVVNSNGNGIQDYDFTDWVTGPQTTPPTPTTSVDFTAPTSGTYNCLPSGFVSLSTSVGGSSLNDNIALAVSTTGGQGSSGMVYIVVHVPSKGCIMWRTDTGAVTADPGFSGGAGLTCSGNTCSGTISTPGDRFTIHNVKFGINDNYLVVTGTTCNNPPCVSGFPTTQYFWQVGTTNVQWSTEFQTAYNGGHDVTGQTKWFNNPGTNHIWQDAIRPLATIGSAAPSLVIPLADFPTFPSTGVGITDAHYSWNNADASDTYPVFWTSLAYASGSPANNWASAFTLPSGIAQLRDMDLNTRNGHWYLIDRVSGVWKYDGSTFTQINTGLPNCNSTNVCGWSVKYDKIHDQVVIGLCNTTNAVCTSASDTPEFWRSSNEGASWTQIPTPVTIHDFPAYNLMDIAGNGNMVIAGYFGQNGTCGGGYSTDGGVTTTGYSISTCPTNGSAPAPGGTYSIQYNPILNVMMLGTEQNGVLCSSDGGVTWSNMSPPDAAKGGISNGNVREVSYDSSGNPIMGTQDGLYKATGGTGCSGWTWSQVALEANGANTISVKRDGKGNIYWAHQKDSLTSSVHWPVSGTGQSGVCSIYVSTDGGLTGSPFCTGLPTRGSPTTGYEPWRIIYNQLDGMMYALIQDPSTNAGLVYKTVLSNSGLAPYGWQNEILATSPTGSGTTWRFNPLFNSAQSQLFQTMIGSSTVSQDGKLVLFNSDMMGTLGSESGNQPCLLAVNCRGDVFVTEAR